MDHNPESQTSEEAELEGS